MQTTRVHIHPHYITFVVGTFLGIDLGTFQSILVADTLSWKGHETYSSGFWTSALLWIVSFFILGIVTTRITGVVRRGILTTFWSSVVAGFITFITSVVVLRSQIDLSPHPSFEHSYNQVGFFILCIVFFYLWFYVMGFSLIFGSAGAGLYRAIQKIAIRFNSAEQLKK